MAAIIKRLQSARSLLNWLKTVDGSGSGLDADTLDGLQGAAYAVLASANTFTANQTISGTGATDRYLTLIADAGRTRGVLLRSSGGLRWIAGADASAESGSNAGTNYVIYRYSDAGSLLGTAVSINRASGAVAVAGALDSVGNLTENGSRVATIPNTNSFTARQNIAPGGTAFCLYLDRGGDTSPHLRIDMSSSVNTGDRFVDFQSAGSTTGSITANGASNVAYNTSSDPRMKKDLTPLDLTESVERIKSLKLWKGKWKLDDAPFRGILTTELQHVIPEAVSGVEDGIEEEWVVGSEEQPRIVIRGPKESGLEKIEARAPKDADLHPLTERIAPQMWDASKCMPDVMGALQWALARIEKLEARIAALESA